MLKVGLFSKRLSVRAARLTPHRLIQAPRKWEFRRDGISVEPIHPISPA
jgi:hypothetical protein